MAKCAERTFAWIVGILRRDNILFRISGGLAARVYGSTRPLRDIDIEVRDRDVWKVLPQVEKWVVSGPGRYVDGSFDLLLLTLRHKGQEVDVFGCGSQKLFNRKMGRWVKSPTGVSCAVRKKVLGRVVPVMTRRALVGYKRIIRRRVDVLDLKALGEQA